MHGYDVYGYGGRHYYLAHGRWETIDPLAEDYYEYSPYVYCGENPVNRFESDGKDSWSTNDPKNIEIWVNMEKPKVK